MRLLLALVCVMFVHCRVSADDRSVRVAIVSPTETAARVSIAPYNPKDEINVKQIAPESATLRKTSRGESYFYADGEFQLRLPEKPFRLIISQGMESSPTNIVVKDEHASKRLAVSPNHWIDMAARHWYSGDSHIHINTGGPIRANIHDALLAGRAEGLNFLNLCVSNNLGDDLRDADKVTGRVEPESTSKVLLSYGEEMRSSIYGHMQFFGIKKVVLPQYTGFDNTPNHLDYPSNYTLAREATDQGGVVTYGHPMLKNSPDAFSTNLTEANGAARELPIDAALGTVQAMDLMSYNCDKNFSTELWYRLLNCGLKLSACVGTDALLDQTTDPLGGSRVYAYVPDGLTQNGWLEALKAGRTFVTNGPMLELSINERLPGDTVAIDKPQVVHGKLKISSVVQVSLVEVIVNGKVAKTLSLPTERLAEWPLMNFDVEIDQSSWIAVRASGPDDPVLFDGPAWAHTGPVYVDVAGQRVKIREDREFFVEWIEKLIRVVNTRNRYPSDQARQEVVETFRKAQEYYK